MGSPRNLAITRPFDAPRGRVWQAWTQPGRVARWCGPKGYKATLCEVDAVPGGSFRVEMHTAEGREYRCRGTYVDVDAPSRLSFTATVLGPDDAPALEQLVTAVFEGADDGTVLTLTVQVRSVTDAGQPFLDAMPAGWIESLDRLAAYLAD